MSFRGQIFFIQNQFQPIREGLQLYWDAGNRESYPASGTTIFDLSGNGWHGTLKNGVGFSNSNGGILTFDGTNDIVTSTGPNLSSTAFTIMAAARYSGAVATRKRMITASIRAPAGPSGFPNNFILGHWASAPNVGSTENYFLVGTWVSSTGAGGNDTNWRIYAGNATSGASRDYFFYVNNALSASKTAQSTGSGPENFALGGLGDDASWTGDREYSQGEFSFLLAYNRVLSIQEMTHNYQIFRSRFNL